MTFNSKAIKKKASIPTNLVLKEFANYFLKRKEKKETKVYYRRYFNCFHVSFLGEDPFRTVRALTKDESK